MEDKQWEIQKYVLDNSMPPNKDIKTYKKLTTNFFLSCRKSRKYISRGCFFYYSKKVVT